MMLKFSDFVETTFFLSTFEAVGIK